MGMQQRTVIVMGGWDRHGNREFHRGLVWHMKMDGVLSDGAGLQQEGKNWLIAPSVGETGQTHPAEISDRISDGTVMEVRGQGG